MIYYISSNTYHQTIKSTIHEHGEVIIGQNVDNHVDLLKHLKTNLAAFTQVDIFLVDLSALDNTEEEILQALRMFRTMYDDTRCVILAPHYQPGSELLSQIFALGIQNIIATNDFLAIKKELLICLSEKGKSFKEALIFKEIKRTEEKNCAEIKAASGVMIGITGSQKRIGVTHYSVMLAGYLRKKGYLVAMVECNPSGDFEKIREDFEAKLYEHDYFTMNGIDYYPGRETVKDIIEKGYNFLVMDLGDYQSLNQEFYHCCHVKVVLSGSKAWEQDYVTEILRQNSPDILSQIHFCFNYTDKGYYKAIRKRMRLPDGRQLKVSFLDYVSDPFNANVLADGDKLLGDYLSDKPPKKRLFGRLRKNVREGNAL